MTRSRWGAVALGVAFFGYTASAVRVGFSPYDDAVFTYGGWAVAHGRVPYEDFWTLYNPGQFWLIGAFFRYVTESVLAFRLFESVLVAASGLIVWDICKRLYSKKTALAVSCVFVLWLGAGSALYPFHENHTLTSLLLLLASYDLLLVAVPQGRPRLAVAAGACAGVCFVIRQDAALYVLAPELIALVLWRDVNGRPWRDVLRRAGAYVAGAAVPIAALVAWVVAVAPGPWWEQAVVFPLTENPALRDLPYEFTGLVFSSGGGVIGFLHVLAVSAREGFFYYVPFAVALGAGALVIVRMRRTSRSMHNLWGFATATILLAASLDYSRVRSDFQHIFTSILLSFLVVPGLATAVTAAFRKGAARIAVATLAVVVALFALVIPIAARLRLTQSLTDGVRLSTGLLAGIVIDNRDNGGSADWAEIQAAASYVRSQTAEDEPIFVTGPRNDRFMLSYPMFYVLAGRMAGTMHAELYPGVTTTEETQSKIIGELDSAGVHYVVRWPAGEQKCPEPNRACHPETPGSLLLDEYLDREYEPVATYDVLLILRRRI